MRTDCERMGNSALSTPAGGALAMADGGGGEGGRNGPKHGLWNACYGKPVAGRCVTV